MTTQLSEDYLLFQDSSKSDEERINAFIRYNEQDIIRYQKQQEFWEIRGGAVAEIMIEFFTKSIESSLRAIERAKKYDK